MSRKIDVEAKGEILILRDTINNMVDRLSIFCNEVQRVAKDVGVDGIMGGQADVAGLKGRWKEITTDVNTMANNLVSYIHPSFNKPHHSPHRFSLHLLQQCLCLCLCTTPACQPR